MPRVEADALHLHSIINQLVKGNLSQAQAQNRLTSFVSDVRRKSHAQGYAQGRRKIEVNERYNQCSQCHALFKDGELQEWIVNQ